MPRPKMIKRSTKDHKVTVRLDDAAYQQLKKGIERGTITNLSEALRSMIRQKLWQEQFSDEIARDLKSGEFSEEIVHGVVQRIWKALKSASIEDRETLKSEGSLEGLLSAVGGLIRQGLEELESREANKKSRSQLNNGRQIKNGGESGKDLG